MKKKIFATLLAILLFAALAGQVSATSNFTSISTYTPGNSYTTATAAKRKENSTDAVAELKNNGFAATYRICVKGCTTSSGTNAVNCTYYNSRAVNYVVCNRDITYSIDTVVRESGYTYAVLSIWPVGGYGTTTGKWAPDSAQTFTSPESAG